jgi:NAD(P)-dependent dehydrogenase (short-subunit alcohol dehydrogenase family)
MQITGSHVLVTGGQRGLGAAFTRALLDAGAERVYVTARTPRPSDDPRVVPLALDVTDQASVDAVAQAASDVDIVINNAGITGPHDVLGTPVVEMQKVFDTNVFGAIRIAQAFAPVLAAKESPTLVDIHSVLSWVGGAGAYGASKAALWSFSNSLRVQLADRGVSVLGVHLGLADTDMTARLDAPKVSPADVAAAVVRGIEEDAHEVLVDEVSASVKQALSGPVEHLVVQL